MLEGGELRKGEHLHPYLAIYFQCLPYGNGMNGAPALPMAGGVLDQDAELMYFFDKFMELSREHEKAKEETKAHFEKLQAETPITVIND